MENKKNISNKKKLTESIHPERENDSDGDSDERPADAALPFSCGMLELGESLAEGSPVESFLLINTQFLPVSLLLLAQGQDLRGGFLVPDGWHWIIHAIIVNWLSTPAIPNHFPLANFRGNPVTRTGLTHHLNHSGILSHSQEVSGQHLSGFSAREEKFPEGLSNSLLHNQDHRTFG